MTGTFSCVRKYFREYCTRSSVHGFQYLGEKRRTCFERIWWVVVFCISLSICTVSIYTVYEKWNQSPVIVNFANSGTPIHNIPFPAVTICPESKSAQDKFNFTKVLQKMEDGLEVSQTEQIHFEYMSLICDSRTPPEYMTNKTLDDDFFDAVDDLKPTFQMLNCSFLGFEQDCDVWFTPLITDEGVCYTFNMLDRENIFREDVFQFKNYHKALGNLSTWTLQNGYPPDASAVVYPFRAFLSGATNGFSLNILTPKQDLDYACKDAFQGYRVLLHTPLTIPRPSQNYFRIPLDQSVVGVVQPVVITTSDRIKKYTPEKRKCYFSTEHSLKFFKNYTASNCKLECLANFTLKLCECVNFFMPRVNGTLVCGSSKMDCMKDAERSMQKVQLSKLLPPEQIKDIENLTTFSCNCLPICSDLTYEVETSQTDWEWEKLLRARRNLPRVDNTSHFSSLNLFFKSDNFISSERNELYGPMDFLANFGGLLGLFTGFSVLSLMEILYFLTIRLVCNTRLYGHWSGEKKLTCT